jgi:hypothetical protein
MENYVIALDATAAKPSLRWPTAANTISTSAEHPAASPAFRRRGVESTLRE